MAAQYIPEDNSDEKRAIGLYVGRIVTDPQLRKYKPVPCSPLDSMKRTAPVPFGAATYYGHSFAYPGCKAEDIVAIIVVCSKNDDGVVQVSAVLRHAFGKAAKKDAFSSFKGPAYTVGGQSINDDSCASVVGVIKQALDYVSDHEAEALAILAKNKEAYALQEQCRPDGVAARRPPADEHKQRQ